MSSQSRNAKGAGRPIQYDRAAAIEAATKLFFEKGFRDTSVQDVVSATGMQTGSVYAAFGSKLALFLECLDTELSALDRRLEPLRELGSDPLQSLMAFWRVGQATFDRPSFAARALVDFTDRDSEVWQRVSVAWAERDGVIEDILRRAQEAGQVRSDLDAGQLQRHVSSLLLGVRFFRHYLFEPGCCTDVLSEETLIEFLQPRAST